MREKKNKSAIDKVIMGAIIGTAVGSAIGASIAPKKGKDTREILKDKAKNTGSDIIEVSKLGKETATGFFKLAKRILFGKERKSRRLNNAKPKIEKHMKEIPIEMDIIPPEHVDRD
ncbi:YtxH domain-containing protein [Candidatus Peregrinibacteria bacterium]|jgi:gas vesicle protein|nr:YtxH domain-containing protein [Candidatus Peregrinibacteria bacterium]MBT4631805.1 YtxH domain-containing protein [Candidatus Peregrinibacteria bacterium]MBT5517309.1 YtxH domain-containing protein [Candidatus Peregrinibacteria bacterium]MBT5824470.1 YtxH domain-containing protein [Candidatus Peregrinibacteria bacterium]